MAIKVILASAAEETLDRMTQIVAEADGIDLVHLVRAASGIQDAIDRNPEAEVVVVDRALDGGRGLAVARGLGATNPLLGIVMLVEHSGPEQFAEAMESGARAVVTTSSSLAEVVARLETVAQWVAAARAAVSSDLMGGRGGKVIAVAGAKGGVGASVVSLLLAQGLLGSRTVAAVDFDLQSGDLSAYLGVHTRRSLVDLVDIAGEMSGRVLRETSYDVPGGLRLLSAPNDGERGEDMTARAARAVVNALRFQFDVSVIDVGTHLTEATATVLEDADVAVLVVTPDLPALRAARRVLAMWERLTVRQPGSVQVVLNRCSRQSEVTEQLAARIVETRIAAAVPEGGSTFVSAMNTATLAATGTPVHAALARFGTGVLDGLDGDRQPAETPVPELRRARGRRRSRQPLDAGQSSIELVVAFPIALLVFLVCAQGVAWGAGFVLSRNAAQEGARTVGVMGWGPTTESVAADDARGELAGPWLAGSSVAVGPDQVRVDVVAPTVFPGVRLTSTATAAVLPEPS